MDQKTTEIVEKKPPNKNRIATIVLVVILIACLVLLGVEIYKYFTYTDEEKSAIEEDETTNPAQPSQPSQPSQPTQPTQPSQPAQPTQPANPAQPTQPANPAQPTNPPPSPQEEKPAPKWNWIPTTGRVNLAYIGISPGNPTSASYSVEWINKEGSAKFQNLKFTISMDRMRPSAGLAGGGGLSFALKDLPESLSTLLTEDRFNKLETVNIPPVNSVEYFNRNVSRAYLYAQTLDFKKIPSVSIQVRDISLFYLPAQEFVWNIENING